MNILEELEKISRNNLLKSLNNFGEIDLYELNTEEEINPLAR